MDQNNENLKQDSVTLGTPAKGGAIKVYLDLNTLTDDEAKEIVRRAKGLYKYLLELN